MAGAIINAINAAPFDASATLRAGSTLFVAGHLRGVGGQRRGRRRSRPSSTSSASRIAPATGWRANQSNAETQFTIILGDVDIDFGDMPNVSYKTLLASNGARHIILSGSSYLGVAVDADPDGRPGVRADGDDGDAWFDWGPAS